MKNLKGKIIGMNKSRYLQNWFDSNDVESNTIEWGYKLYFRLSGDRQGILMVELSERLGSCYSGYCDASWGEIEYSIVDEVGSITHSPKTKAKSLSIDFSYLKIEWFNGKLVVASDNEKSKYYDEEDGLTTGLFYCNYDGGDEYYSRGYVGVEEDLFVPNARFSDKLKTHIFVGNSGLGKSFIGNILSDNSRKVILETDSSQKLPKVIYEDLIVVGNKHSHTLQDVISRIDNKDERELIVVDFKTWGDI